MRIFKEALTLPCIYYRHRFLEMDNMPLYDGGVLLGNVEIEDDDEVVNINTWRVSPLAQYDAVANERFSHWTDPPLADFLGLTLVSKQVRQECIGLVLEANTLHIGHFDTKITYIDDALWMIVESTKLAIDAIPAIYHSNQGNTRLHLALDKDLLLAYWSQQIGDFVGGRNRLNQSVSGILGSVHPGALTITIIMPGHIPPSLQCRYPNEAICRSELRANDGATTLAAFDATVAREHERKLEFTRRGDDTGRLLSQISEILMALLRFMIDLIRSMDKAFAEAASKNSKSTDLLVSETDTVGETGKAEGDVTYPDDLIQSTR